MARLNYIVTIISVILMCVFAEEERYSDKYDYIDVAAIMEDDAHRIEYYNCFMNTRPCVSPDEKFFGAIISEVIQTNCQKCTERQKEMHKISKDWWSKNEPANWEKLVAKSAEDMRKKKEERRKK